VVEKAQELLEPVLGQARTRRLMEAIDTLETLSSVRICARCSRVAISDEVDVQEDADEKSILSCAVTVLGSAALLTEAAEKPYPEKPVRVLVGWLWRRTDTVTRVMTQRLSDVLGQPFVVDNRPSAGGNVAVSWPRAPRLTVIR